MRHGRSGVPPRGMGKAEEKEGAACTAGNDWHPMLWLSVNPKIPRTWLWVTSLRDKVGRDIQRGREGKGRELKGKVGVGREGGGRKKEGQVFQNM